LYISGGTSDNTEMHRYLLGWEDVRSLAEVCHLPSLKRAAELLGLRLEKFEGVCSRPCDISVVPAGSTYLLSAGAVQFSISNTAQMTHFLAVAIPWTFSQLSPYPVFHASGCLVKGEAVLFCGGSQTGKSSLAAVGWEKGFSIINDDRTAVEPSYGTVRPYPQALSLRLQKPEIPEPFASVLTKDGPYCLGRGWKSNHWVLLGRSLERMVPYGVSFPVKTLYFLRRGMSTRRIPVDKETALRNVLTHTFRTQSKMLAILPFIETLWRQNKIYELIVGEGDVSGAFSLAISPFA